MSAERLVPSTATNPDFSSCGDWLRKNKEEQYQKMVIQMPEGGFAEEPEEPEPPLAAIRRKVSFADAFGLDLVSVKEFDNQETSGLGDLLALLGAQSKPGEEHYLSCLFTCPASDLELKMRLYQQKLELESIELLPGSTTIRGIVRVLNLCFHKAVYVHTTLDGWQSHFDLLAEFVPGSSDGETDRFSFQLILTPPFGAEGARVEFCLRYESAAGTFWANNSGANYIFFCHQRRRSEMREREKEREQEKLIDDNNQKGIRSCLKTNSKKVSTETTSTEGGREISERVAAACKTEITTHKETEMTSPKSLMDCCKCLVDRHKRRRAVRVSHVQEYFSQKETESLAGVPHTGETSTDLLVPTPPLSLSNLPPVHNQHHPPILMYPEIPLLSLDWGSKTTAPAEPNAVHDRTVTENVQDHRETSACDAWEAFLNGADQTHPHDDTWGSRPVSGCKGSVDWSAGGILESHPTEKPKDSNTGSSKVQDYKPQEEPRVTPTTCADTESEGAELELEAGTEEAELEVELEGVGLESEGAGFEAGPEEAEVKSERCGDLQNPHPENMGGPLSNDITLTIPGEETQIAHDLKTQNFKGGDEISPEEFTGRSNISNAEAKVKENTGRPVKDTLTFTGIRDEPLADRRSERSSEKKDINKSSETERKDSVEKVKTRFYPQLPEEEEMKSARIAQDKTLELTSETQNMAFNENDSRMLNTNVKTHVSELQKDQPQSLDAEDELPTLPRIHLSWPGSTAGGGSNSRLSSWWALFLSVGHVTRALVCSAVVFVMLVTAYVCDLPTCLALYLFSLGWWCSQGGKQRLNGAVDVDLHRQEVLAQ